MEERLDEDGGPLKVYNLGGSIILVAAIPPVDKKKLIGFSVNYLEAKNIKLCDNLTNFD